MNLEKQSAWKSYSFAWIKFITQFFQLNGFSILIIGRKILPITVRLKQEREDITILNLAVQFIMKF